MEHPPDVISVVGLDGLHSRPMTNTPPSNDPFVIVLGVAQDGGHPQAGCRKSCCAAAWSDTTKGHFAACLGVVEPVSNEVWMIDATPDFPHQLHALTNALPDGSADNLSGIVLTHGHMGHILGLAYLGRESMGAQSVPLFAMPRMARTIRESAPWKQLVRLNNVVLQPMQQGEEFALNSRIRVLPQLVPHRADASETVGLIISGPTRKVFFLPDVDRWDRWSTPIEPLIGQVDRAYLDGTFFHGSGLGLRATADHPDPLSNIPHPFVVDSLARFSTLDADERSKIHLIHFNHTNPLLQPTNEHHQQVFAAGMHITQRGDQFSI